MHASAPIPVTLLTGFLGSGKTTLLNRLVQQPAMRGALVIINEFGAVGLDHLLVAHTAETIVEMSSGCLCCTIRGDLSRTLREALWRFARGGRRQFDRVVIETTGLADPAPILQTLMADDTLLRHFRLDGVVTTVDLVNGADTFDRQPEAVRQAAVADTLLLTKSDLATPVQVQTMRSRLHALNPAADQRIVRNGEIDAGALLDLGLLRDGGTRIDVRSWLHTDAYEHARPDTGDLAPQVSNPGQAHGHAHEHAHDHDPAHAHDHHQTHDPNRHDDRIRAFCFTHDEPIAPARFEEWLQLLMAARGPDLLRVKGIVSLTGSAGPHVLHAVQHVIHPLVALPNWPDADRRTRIVFITRDLDPVEVARLFDATAW